MTFISNPIPALLGIWLKRTEFRSAARPVSAPASAKTEQVIRAVLSPARRAACVGSGGVDRASGREIPHAPAQPELQRGDNREGYNGVSALRKAEPLKSLGEILDPRPLRRPSQGIPERDHRGQRHHDRWDADVGDKRPVQPAERRPGQAGRHGRDGHRRA